ncbi:hypothetical protein CLAFUW4_09701 [Fulvia fulva]|nr:hypothetical protein CLAFUR4_09706 [Fulvia fulva]WPV20813.1 hypothetical protein CLAFUW4_09701 [Fulvia fulva]
MKWTLYKLHFDEAVRSMKVLNTAKAIIQTHPDLAPARQGTTNNGNGNNASRDNGGYRERYAGGNNKPNKPKEMAVTTIVDMAAFAERLRDARASGPDDASRNNESAPLCVADAFIYAPINHDYVSPSSMTPPNPVSTTADDNKVFEPSVSESSRKETEGGGGGR